MDKDLLLKGIKLPIMEEFYSLQGEGFHTGKAAYFLRIGGCDVGCSFCDVKESWDANLHPPTAIKEVLERVLEVNANTVVVTGGEPCLYNLSCLCDLFSKKNIKLHLETSGAEPLTGKWDWICFSPKKNTRINPLFFTQANELKVIIETAADFEWAEANALKVSKNCELFLQPEWSECKKMMPQIVRYILENPKWKISLQSHKYMKIP